MAAPSLPSLPETDNHPVQLAPLRYSFQSPPQSPPIPRTPQAEDTWKAVSVVPSPASAGSVPRRVDRWELARTTWAGEHAAQMAAIPEPATHRRPMPQGYVRTSPEVLSTAQRPAATAPAIDRTTVPEGYIRTKSGVLRTKEKVRRVRAYFVASCRLAHSWRRQPGSHHGVPANSQQQFTPRTKTGCLTCRLRKKKCDEYRPQCSNCFRNGLRCTWPNVAPRKDKSAKSQSPPANLQSTSASRQSPPTSSLAHAHLHMGPRAQPSPNVYDTGSDRFPDEAQWREPVSWVPQRLAAVEALDSAPDLVHMEHGSQAPQPPVPQHDQQANSPDWLKLLINP